MDVSLLVGIAGGAVAAAIVLAPGRVRAVGSHRAPPAATSSSGLPVSDAPQSVVPHTRAERYYASRERGCVIIRDRYPSEPELPPPPVPRGPSVLARTPPPPPTAESTQVTLYEGSRPPRPRPLR